MKHSIKSTVSVVVMTYQSSKFVLETLESIKSQTWENIELIISDDASTDNTVELCLDFIEKNRDRFTNIKVIVSEKNKGIPANYNQGIKATSGRWIKFVDADDVLLENCIKDNVDYANKHPSACFITSDVIEIDANSNIIREQVRYSGMQYMMSKETPNEQLKVYTRYPFFINSPTFFAKSSLMKKINYCDENFKIYEDTTMIFRILIKGKRIHYLNKPTVKYRIHAKSISRDEQAIKRREMEEYKIFKKYRKQHLNLFNPIDLSVLYEVWLSYKYKGFRGRKGLVVLRLFSLHYWQLKLKGLSS